MAGLKKWIGWEAAQRWASTEGSFQPFWWEENERADGLKRAHSQGHYWSSTPVVGIIMWYEHCAKSLLHLPQKETCFDRLICSALSNCKHVLIKKCYKYIYVKHIFEHLVFEDYFLKKRKKERKCLYQKNTR